MDFINKFYDNYNIEQGGRIVVSIALILLIGFALTRITKLLRLPNVTAYILTGVLIGPFSLNLIPQSIITSMSFITDIALGFIAFGVGKYFNLDKLKKKGLKISIITVMESFTAAILITLAMYFIFKLPLPFCLLLGAISSATSPASTIMTIKQYHCKGEFVDTVLEVVALDDVTSLLAFSVASAIAVALLKEGSNFDLFQSIILPILLNMFMIAVGIGFGFILSVLITSKRTMDNRLIIVIGMILALVGLSYLLKIFGSTISISPLLSCMAMGTVYMNKSHDKKLFYQLSDFSAPVSLLFFVNSGLGFDITALRSVGIIGIVYFLVRIGGKYLGASLGGLVTKSDKKITRFLGMALVPQAGVSIGLAALGARVLGGTSSTYGSLLSTIIISSGILYELVGPAMAKLSLSLTKSMNQTNITKDSSISTDNSEKVLLPALIPTTNLAFLFNKGHDSSNDSLLKLQNEINELNQEIHYQHALMKYNMSTPESSWRLGPIRHNRFPSNEE